jgi:tRNA-splicing ligase RtcB
MRVPGLVFADEKLLKDIGQDQALQQVANVAHLPGIVKASMAMPDIHWGYGFPIGGVAATDPEAGGVVSPGGVGFDINCGLRLMKTELTVEEVQPRLKTLVATLFNTIPCGVGMSGDIRFNQQEAPRVMTQGSRWAVAHGYGVQADLEHTESQGALEGADPDMVSERAVKRGHDQLGTLGSGNHFLEVQAVETIFDEGVADAFGLRVGQVTVMIHSGSRGFGYQICDDYLEVMERAMHLYGIKVPDRQLACAPIKSEEGQRYLGAIRCAANFAWGNRQCLMHLARGAFERVFGTSWERLGMTLIYDVAHNIAKFERYRVNGEEKTVCVHRKGATRAFPPGHPEIPEDYRDVGQPVIIPGDMGRNSYLLVGTVEAMEQSFGTVCHGAGRVMSRAEAVRKAAGRSIEQELEQQGIIVMGRGRKGLAEEQPSAYKDVNDVVQVVHNAGLAKRVVRMRPLGVIKG